MAEFVGGEPISVGVDEPITFENKTYTAFDVGCGIVFRKSGLYRVCIVGKHMSVSIEPERKKGHWIHKGCGCFECDQCGELISTNVYIIAKASARFKFCPSCGADMREEGEE